MVADLYESILQEVGTALGVALAPDRYDSCQVRLDDGLKLQLEIYKRTNQFLICFHLGGPPPGRYRENLLREALKANGLPSPKNGILGYSEKSELFYLFELLPQERLDGKKVMERILAMREKALTWTTAIANGDVPHVVSGATSGGGGMGPFGIRG